MNYHNAARDELFELASALGDGDFTPQQADRLRVLLTADGDLLPVYVRTLLLQALLHGKAGRPRPGMEEGKTGILRLDAAASVDGRVSHDADGLPLPARQAPPTICRTAADKTPSGSAGKWWRRLDRLSWVAASTLVVAPFFSQDGA